MIEITIGKVELSILAILFTIIQFLIILIVKTLVQRETNKILERIKWEYKTREKAEKIAEYLALALNLDDNCSREDFRKADQLAFELAIWLPKKNYESLINVLKNQNDEKNFFTVLNEIREYILEDDYEEISFDYAIRHFYSYEIEHFAHFSTQES